jgi:cobalt-zinc-cadmium efflux system protein
MATGEVNPFVLMDVEPPGRSMTHNEHKHSDIAEKNLFVTMALNFAITIVEVIGGIVSGSLSLLSDAMHNFSDGIAIVISYGAIRLSRRPRTLRHTFGLKRAELLAAIINASTLIVISFFLIREAIQRLSNPVSVGGPVMLTVAAVGLVANYVGTLLLKKGAGGNLNIRAAYVHLLTDTVASLAVILGAIGIMLFNISWIDPVLSILIALYIIGETYSIVRESVDVIMMAVPTDVDINGLQHTLEAIPGVKNIHHVHVWRLNDTEIHFEAHIDVDDMYVSETANLQKEVERRLHEQGGITHATLQFECDVCKKKGLVG